MKAYPSYIDSHVSWLGEIPKNWTTIRTKFLLAEDKFRSGPFGSSLITSQLSEKGNYLIYTPEHIAAKNIERQMFVPEGREKELLKYLISEGDIVLPIVGTLGLAKLFTKNDLPGILNQRLCRITPDSDKVVPEYLLFLFKEAPFIKTQLELQKKGAILDHITKEVIFNFSLPLPTLGEQESLLNYLNHQTTLIDALIEKKQRLLELLKEQRQAIITEAVTKGLNPNAPMKDSGIPWLGEIPEHWEVGRLANQGEFLRGRGLPKGDVTGTGGPVILYGDLYTTYDISVSEPFRKTDPEIAQTGTELVFDDLLFTCSGETKEDIGKCVCFRGAEKTYAGGDLLIFRKSNDWSSLYLSYVFNSNSLIFQKAASSRGEIVVHIYKSQIRDLIFPVAPAEEQEMIAETLASKDALFLELDTKINAQIELLQEQRQTIISEAVTGKIDVRDWKPELEIAN